MRHYNFSIIDLLSYLKITTFCPNDYFLNLITTSMFEDSIFVENKFPKKEGSASEAWRWHVRDMSPSSLTSFQNSALHASAYHFPSLNVLNPNSFQLRHAMCSSDPLEQVRESMYISNLNSASMNKGGENKEELERYS